MRSDIATRALYSVQADGLEIEAAAKRRLADEYDAAQERGEVATDGRPKTLPDQKGFSPPTTKQVGLTYKEVHDARQFRDAEVVNCSVSLMGRAGISAKVTPPSILLQPENKDATVPVYSRSQAGSDAGMSETRDIMAHVTGHRPENYQNCNNPSRMPLTVACVKTADLCGFAHDRTASCSADLGGQLLRVYHL